ncbi:MAG TPA: PAS domain S-box protein [Candidatus Bathyarchaeia archaeon]|nr:PAS domain S-box protein [Candidatus Bathyarchaeia archaeon]
MREPENVNQSVSDGATTPVSESEPAAYALLNALFDSVLVLDRRDVILALNQAAALWLGTSFSDAVGAPVGSVLSGELATRITAWRQEAVASKMPLRTEAVIDTKRKIFSVYPVREQSGHVSRIVVAVRDVTDEQRMREEYELLAGKVAKQARTLEGILSASADLIYVFDRESRYIYVNRPGARVLGFTPHEMVGKTWTELGLPLQPMQHMIALGDIVFATGRSVTDELHWSDPSGEKYYEYVLTPIYNEEGSVEALISTARDVTGRRSIEASVRRERDQAQQYLDTADVLMVVLDAAGRITRLNRPGCELLGVQQEQVLGKDWFKEFVPDRARKRALRGFKRFIGGEIEPYRRSEIPVLTVRGEERDMEWHNALLKDVGGAIVGTLSSGTDVTERNRMGAALEQSERKYRELVQGVNSVIFQTDLQGNITFLNKHGQQLFGLSEAEAIGRKLAETLVSATESAKSEFSSFAESLLHAADGYMEIVSEHVTKDGRRLWIEWMCTALFDNQRNFSGVLGAGIDISRRLEAEKALKNVERLAAIGETATMVGHDLRNPLQAIRFAIDLQRKKRLVSVRGRGRTDSEDIDQLCDLIDDQVRYMDKIVADLQAFAQPLHPEQTQIRAVDLIASTLSSMKVPAKVKVKTNIPKDLSLYLDRELMQRVFTNLILNAIQAMPEGGRLTISAAASNGQVSMTVEDSGVGIRDDIKEKLFSPLVTNKAKGTGLGLAVCKRIVELHDGTITVESEEGRGARFVVTLPS